MPPSVGILGDRVTDRNKWKYACATLEDIKDLAIDMSNKHDNGEIIDFTDLQAIAVMAQDAIDKVREVPRGQEAVNE